MRKRKASGDGVKRIKELINDKGWTSSGDRQTPVDALFEINQQQLRKYLKIHNMSEDFLTIENLETLVAQERFAKGTSTDNINKYIRKLRRNQQKQISFDNLLEEMKFPTVNTDKVTSRNWRNFKDGKEIDEDIYGAFWEALGIEDWHKFTTPSLIDYQYVTNDTRLVDGLSSFNHKTQVRLLLQNLDSQRGIFLVKNPCAYSRTWMLRRLANKVYEVICLECQSICLTPPQYVNKSTAQNPNALFYQRKFTEISKLLKKQHLILTLDIDNYNFHSLEEFFKTYWQPLVTHINQSNSRYEGKMLMFLLCSDKKNDWVIKCENSQFHQYINHLPPPSNNDFTADEVFDLLIEITARLGKEQSQDIEASANDIFERSQGSAYKLLQEVYSYFKCENTTWSSVWQKYP